MITATCRTCHKDWTLDKLPSTRLFNVFRTIVLEAPCGHGRYVGGLAFPPQLEERDNDAETVREGYEWEWQDTAFDDARSAVSQWHQEHPYPTREPWNPPPLTITCACGTPITLVGEEELEDSAEGWSGVCPTCELSAYAWDSEGKQSYTQKREAAFERAYKKWRRDEPRYPDGLIVTSLQESADEISSTESEES